MFSKFVFCRFIPPSRGDANNHEIEIKQEIDTKHDIEIKQEKNDICDYGQDAPLPPLQGDHEHDIPVKMEDKDHDHKKIKLESNGKESAD